MEWLIPVLGVLLGGAGLLGVLTWRQQRAKLAAEAAKTEAEAAKTLVEAQGIALTSLQGEVGRMASRMTAMGEELTQLRTDGAQLRTDLTAVSFRAQRAETHAASIHDWIDGGMEPPPPTRPVWLQVGRLGLAATSTTTPPERED